MAVEDEFADVEVDEEGWYWDEELGDWAKIYEEEEEGGMAAEDEFADVEADEEGWYWDEELGDWANIYE